MARTGRKKPVAKRPRKRVRNGAADKAGKASRRKGAPAVEMALAALAHDIRTPLTGILALAELLAASDIGERERGWAAGIKSAAEHLAQLTTVVTDAVKADAARLVLRRDVFSPRRFTESVGAALLARAQTLGLKAEVVIDPALPENVIGDPVRLRAALENLIDNAVKFTAQGSVTLAVRAKPVSRGRVRLSFDVADSGIGLRESEIKKLFKPFSQASAEVSRRYGGTGLGLTLVKRLAKAMGGDLKVTSRLAEGSTFHLGVTVGRMSAAAVGTKRAAGTETGKPAAELTILCVEDNPYGRVVLATILRELGHRVSFASSGEAALAALARDAFDAVLMDVSLSGIDGFETTRRIRALLGASGKTPVIGISAGGSAADEVKAREAGMDAYLVKPVSPQLLARAIESARLERH
jgi:two-component system, sensor histidine kinase